jgi:hypothetical protein
LAFVMNLKVNAILPTTIEKLKSSFCNCFERRRFVGLL